VSAFFKGVCAFFTLFLPPPVHMLSPVHFDMIRLIILRNFLGLARGQAGAVADAIWSHTHPETFATSHISCWTSDCRAE
jgi:hypothetical protein